MYITQSDVEARFGSENVAIWADLDNDGSADTGRVAAAISYAEGFMESSLRGTGYTVPFSFNNTRDQQLMKSMMAELAGWWLYTSRGIKEDEPSLETSAIRKNIDRFVQEVRRGAIRLDAAKDHDYCGEGPGIV